MTQVVDQRDEREKEEPIYVARLSVYLPEALKRLLEDESRRRAMKQTEVVREIIREHYGL